MFAGIHFRTATEVGSSLGAAVGQWVLENAFQRVIDARWPRWARPYPYRSRRAVIETAAAASAGPARDPLPELLEPVQDHRDVDRSVRARCGGFGHQEAPVDR